MDDIFEANTGEVRIGRLIIQFKMDEEVEKCKIVAAGVLDGEMVHVGEEVSYETFSRAIIDANRAAEVTFLKALESKTYKESGTE